MGIANITFQTIVPGFCIGKANDNDNKSLFGLYSEENKAEILSPQYTRIELVGSDYTINHFFYLVDPSSGSFLFLSGNEALFKLSDYPFDRFDSECIVDDIINYHHVSLLRGVVDGRVFFGSLSIESGCPCLQVPVLYQELIHGKDFIAAYDESRKVSFFYCDGKEDSVMKNRVYREYKELPGEIQNITVMFNNPYPIVKNKICLFGIWPELFDLAIPINHSLFCIVINDGLMGLWQERRTIYDREGELVLTCCYNRIVPDLDLYPFKSTDHSIGIFFLNKHGKWGLFSYGTGVVIPPMLDEYPRIVYSYRTHDDIDISTPQYIICRVNGRYGVLNMKRETVIPFDYQDIEAKGIIINDYYADCDSRLFFLVKDDAGYSLFEGCRPIIPDHYSSISVCSIKQPTLDPFRDQETRVYFICEWNGLFGLKDYSGNTILPFEYKVISFNRDRGGSFSISRTGEPFSFSEFLPRE